MYSYKKILKSSVLAGLIAGNSLLASNEIIEPNGLNQIKEIIQNDSLINKKLDEASINEAQNSIDQMNALIRKAIFAKGLVNDDELSVADVREINLYLVENHLNEWYQLRGDPNDKDGYYAVQVARSNTIVLNRNAIKHLWAKVYDLGFPVFNKHRLSTYDGRKNIGIREVASWLSQIMKDEIVSASLKNSDFEEIKGSSNTALDQMLELILKDKGLHRKISTSDLRDGIEASNEMNLLIIEAIINEGLGNDKTLSTADVRQINKYLVAKHSELWKELHGDDENNEETGYHLIQNDGASSRMFADNVVNSIADGIYHLGFPTKYKDRLENEDGNKNKRFEKVAWWLDTILKKDLEENKLANPQYQEVIGTTGTTFDRIIPAIYNDEGLLLKVSMEDIREGAKSANGMNELIVEAIKATNSAQDNHISKDDIRNINAYLVQNHANTWSQLHGDDENTEETGFHKIQNDGARSIVDNRNLINNLADSIYHLGFKTPFKNRLANEDGDKNASFNTVAYWMNKYLKEDLQTGLLK